MNYLIQTFYKIVLQFPLLKTENFFEKNKEKKRKEYCIYIFKKDTSVYGNGRWPQKKVGPDFVKKILKKLKVVFATFINAAKNTFALCACCVRLDIMS